MKTLLETMTIYWLSTSKNKNETTLHGAKSDIWQESIIQHLFNVGRCKLHLPTYSHNFDPQIKMCVYESCLTNLTYILTLWLSTLIQYVINIGAFCMSKEKKNWDTVQLSWNLTCNATFLNQQGLQDLQPLIVTIIPQITD